jgi:hypothetical protein
MPASVYPTGTTIFYPEKCWNGYTLFQTGIYQFKGIGAILINMNGNPVKQWKGLEGCPNKMLPGGHVIGSTGCRNFKYGFQDMLDLIQVDWDGNIVWQFDKYQRVKDPRQKPRWMLRQHHDFQREGNPVGYYTPGLDPHVDRGYTLILCHKNLKNPLISDKLLLDDSIIEVSWDGKINWEWVCSEHFDEMGFSEEAKNTLSRHPGMQFTGGKAGDWMHINSISTLGPNRWFDNGDVRFHPDNIIWCGRQTNIIAVTDRQTGKIVWQLGPEFTATQSLRNIGQIIGQHHAHLIPRGLPGEGNILVFDNGGHAGYGAPNPGAPTGFSNALRDHSRVLEINPVTLAVVWQYPPRREGFINPTLASFYSSFISSAQRFPNGNTLITEGSDGRIFEVTAEHEIVWEYLSPYAFRMPGISQVYRAYRVPYDWVPRLARPEEKEIARLDNYRFRVPGTVGKKSLEVTNIKR